MFRFLNNKSYYYSSGGFTLVEALVSIGLFSVMISIAAGGFVQALRAERQATSLIAANSGVSESVEQMAREIRTGSEFCDASVVRNTVSYACGSPEELIFTDAFGRTVIYRLAGNAILREVWNMNVRLPESGNLTASNVAVRYLLFTLQGNLVGDGMQARISISLGVSPHDQDLQGFLTGLHTTVSSRQVDS